MKMDVSNKLMFLLRFLTLTVFTSVLICTSAWAQDPLGAQSLPLREIFDIRAPQDKNEIDEEFRKRASEASPLKQVEKIIPEAGSRSYSPRIIVNKFTIKDAKDFPKLKIYKQDLEEIAEALRRKYMRTSERGPGGYTQNELDEITSYLNSINSSTKLEDLDYETFQSLLDVVREHRQNKGLSFAEIEEVANYLTEYLRQKGLLLAQVILPAQDVEDGVVHLQVLEGVLSEVIALNNKQYSDKRLISPFRSLIGSAVEKKKVEENIYLLNDLPGLSLMGIFGAGEEFGETKLSLAVREEESFSFLMRLDNHGSELTGNTRLYANMRWHNPIGIGDALSIGYLRAEELGSNNSDEGLQGVFSKKPEARTNLGQISYSLPVFGLRNRLTLSADRSEFDVVDEKGGLINALELAGVNTQYFVGLQRSLIRQFDFNMSMGVALTDKTSETTSSVNVLDKKDHAQGGELNFYIDGFKKSGLRMLNTANFTVQYGSFKTPTKTGQDKDFIKGTLDTGSLFFIPIPFSDNYTRLITNTKIQYSDSALPSFEQFSLGGANAVRAFKVGDFSADKAFFINNEWYFNSPSWQVTRTQVLNDILQVGLLLDYAYGTKNGGYTTESGYRQEDEWGWMSAVGLVIKTTWSDYYTGKITLAQPIRAKSSNDPKNKNSTIKPLNSEPHSITVYADFNFLF